MIITSYSNIDFIQGVIGYGNATEGITDWRLENTGAGVFNIHNSSSIITPSGGTTEIGQITNSTDRYMIFKGGTSTFIVPSGGIVCDILVIGGGGGGGKRGGAGGGAGACLYHKNVNLNAGTFTVNVGNGGLYGGLIGNNQGGSGSPGSDSSIIYNSTTIYRAKGGGGGQGGSSDINTSGGSSGGGTWAGAADGLSTDNIFNGTTVSVVSNQYQNTLTSPEGCRGNIGGNQLSNYKGGGGGGAGSSGMNHNPETTNDDGYGGLGLTIDITGSSIVYAGGGNGSDHSAGLGYEGGNQVQSFNPAYPTIQSRGGGGYGSDSGTAQNGLDGTGGGGGGQGSDAAGTLAGSGGSGIVIIRYSIANISIIDNGNVGIGTAPITSSSKLEIYGDINISGNYRLNNRDVINDTSNYMLTTSNTLVPRIITEVGHGSNYVGRIATQLNTRIDDTSNYVAITCNLLVNNVSSQWTNVSSGIHFTPTTSTPVITSTPVAPTIGTTGDYTYMSFTYTTETAGAGTGQTQYTINVPTGGVICDILMVGGGGGGDKFVGGGGGGGAVLYATNADIPVGSYTIKVGKGGVVNQNGTSTEAFGATCLGGGSTLFVDWPTPNNGRTGGSGSGGSAGGSTGTGGGVGTSTKGTLLNSATLYNGNSGGNGLGQVGISSPYFGQPVCSGGGGGAGSAGLSSKQVHYTTRSSWIADGKPGTGGDGVQINITGTTYYWGAGGGGSSYDTHAGDGGLGGGGGGASSYSRCPEGFAGTGGINNGNNGTTGDVGGNAGNGTGSGGGGGNVAGNGGSGIVIIRFLSSTRNVGIGTTYPTSELHVFDDTTNNTKLTVQNNYLDPIVISPNTIGYTVAETVESNKFYRTLTFNYFPNYPEDPPNTSLLAWYRFDGNGLDYNPYSTKYNFVAEEGTPTYSSGTSEDSFFQGRRYINTATGSLRSTTLALSSRAFSVSMWLRFKTAGQGASILCQSITQTGNTTLYIGARGNAGYFLGFHGNDLECGVGVSGSPTSYPGDVNTWVHLVYVVLPNYNRRIYRNSVLIATDSNTSAFTGTGDLSFNRRYWNGNAYVNMDVSDIRIYNNGLSAAEVATLYASYTNLVITDNYKVNFKSPMTLLVNGTSRTVNGAYTLSMGHLNDSMLPASGQTDIPLASTILTSLPIKYEYSNTALSLPALITVNGATSSFIGTTERSISFTYTSDSAGLTGQTQYSFTPTEDLWCDILVVGGGGGGGKFGGGGGGGGVLLGTNLKINGGSSVSIKVAKGGTGSSSTQDVGVNGTNGFDSSITINSIEYIAKGGGGGGSRGGGPNYIGTNGTAGGSGGGGGTTYTGSSSLGGVSNKNNYANFQSFGNDGGKGRPNATGSEPAHTSGGGGGAGSVGSDFSYSTGGGNGGLGKEFITYFGTNVGHNGYFAGGGGGNTYINAGNRGYGNGGLGFYGGGGNGGYDGTIEYFAEDGLPNTGGGGGGAKYDAGIAEDLNGGNGGTGFIIIRYRKNQTQSASLELITAKQLPNELVVSGTTSTSSGIFDRCIVFPYTTETISGSGQTQYIFSITEELICDILVVAGGGGGGGWNAGGGGAGGLVLIQNILLSGNFTINVGDGGSGGPGTLADSPGLVGKNTTITKSDNSIIITANGGGRGGATYAYAGNGGSGGGGGYLYANGTQTQKSQTQTGVSSPAILNQFGENGGHGGGGDSSYPGGGGGGAGGVGATSGGNETGQNGGLGIDRVGEFIFKEKFNTSVGDYGWFAGGGGSAGGYQNTSYAYGNGGASMFGGGGNGDNIGRGINGINGTGGGGGGVRYNTSLSGGKGGSGIVIIRYRSTKIGYQGYNIGNYNGDFKIISTNSSTNTDFMRITRDGASIYNPTGSPLWSTVSDMRIKENIEKASYDKCYDSINKLELYRFSYIKELNNINKDLKQLGYIAQEVQGIFPKAVSTQKFYNNNLSISDMLSIDVTQINYSLYGAVKKLIEMYNDIEKQISIIENILNIDNTILNIPIDTSSITSNITLDISNSNITLDTSNSNITLDTSNSNLTLDTTTSNITLDTTTSNITLDTTTSNITLDTTTSNITLDTTTSNITLDTTTSNITLDTSNSNIILDTSNSNIALDTTTSNLSN